MSGPRPIIVSSVERLINNGSFAPAKAESDKMANSVITAAFSDFKNMSCSFINTTVNCPNIRNKLFDLNQPITTY
jgi:hypothetical protein